MVFNRFAQPFYRGIQLNSVSIVDLIIDNLIVVELKSVKMINEVHKAQALNYINLLDLPKALILNFNCANLASQGRVTRVNAVYASLPSE
ncbi:GxxExxY protein [Neolewinella agarilytica]|uniref:GxxExxY protein n=1 Tax=Neolewinella agarilytica TaxID=478744 RepID=A0A1H9J6B2_9BACT|nr:GxxExxY protein [Neolewinella agarilytica]